MSLILLQTPPPLPILSCSSNRTSIFVNGRSGPVIMDDMKKRIQRGDISMEKADAIRVSLQLKFTGNQTNDQIAGYV